MYKQKLRGLDDMMKDGKYQGMTFNPVDYGEDNNIIRKCKHCPRKMKQGEMAELSKGSQMGSGDHQLYSDGIFICPKCWDKKYRFAEWQA